mgnify:FL=1
MRNLTTALRIFFFLIFCTSPLAFETNKTATFENAEQLDPSRIKRLITKYKNTASENEPQALNNLGTLYLKGLGVDKNEKQAKEYFLLAAKLGFPPAMYHVGLIFHKGLGVSADPARAEYWFRKAAALGDVDAQFFLATILASKVDDEKKILESLEWFQLAAQNGLVTAQYNLAITRKRVNPSQMFDETSIYWLNAAAEKLHFESLKALYVFHYSDRNRNDSLSNVVSKLKRIAELGDERAQYLLGLSYYAGKGIYLDEQEGLFWIKQAALGGLLEAREYQRLFSISKTSPQSKAVEYLRSDYFSKQTDISKLKSNQIQTKIK